MIKILLSPAKSLNTEGSLIKPHTTQAHFLKEANQLAKKMQKISSKKLEEMMHISKELADLNKYRYENWISPEFENEQIKACIELFNGEAYKGLDVFTFSNEDFLFAQESLRILSGLYGILKPLDLIYPYRLEMGTKWKIDSKTPSLYAFWKNKLAKQLNNETSSYIINLASTEYFKAIDPKQLKAKVITPVFKDFKNGEYKVIMMYAKNARGSMARYCIQNKLDNPEQLKLYNENGYSYDEKLSSESEWVFTRVN
jgi:cytoplasmic iron level regulating protein YaaA (DUF328/UPF0246 family)